MIGWKKKDDQLANLRKVGVVERNHLAVERAGHYWRSSHRWIPWVSLWIKACCTIAFLGALACLVIVFTRPRPVLLVSYPDGLTLCSMPPLNPKTGQPFARPSGEARLCKELSSRTGRGTDEENLQFAKESQREPETEKLTPLSAAAVSGVSPIQAPALLPPTTIVPANPPSPPSIVAPNPPADEQGAPPVTPVPSGGG